MMELKQNRYQGTKSHSLKMILVAVVGCMLVAECSVSGYEMGDTKSKSKDTYEGFKVDDETTTAKTKSWMDETCEDLVYPTCPSSYQDKTPLLLISVDGFRMEYLEQEVTPHVKKLRECGTTAPYMRPSFPTNTFPNHYTIVTGLYPEHHGIVENNFKDPNIDGHFSLGSEDTLNPDYWWGEPIWNTAMKQGKIAHTFFWPGSDVKIGGMYPNWTIPYNESIGYEERVDKVISWMASDAEVRPDFATLYFDQPDHTGHSDGAWSTEVKEELEYVDSLIDRLMQGLYDHGILGCVNVILLADHGMTSTSCDSSINVFDLNTLDMNVTDMGYFYSGSFGRIGLEDDSPESRNSVQSQLTCRDSHMRVYQKNQVPKRRHYSFGDRITGIQMELDPGWSLGFKYQCLKGQHGYDNIHHEMRALFLAFGPAFKTYEQEDGHPFENIELYNLMCAVMGITPAENDGTQGSLYNLLRNPPPYPEHQDEVPLPSNTFPKMNMEYRRRFREAKCDCVHSLMKQKALDSSLPDSSEYDSIIIKHLPWGAPVYNSSDLDLDISLQVQHDYVTGYSKNLKIPLWTSFTIKDWDPEETHTDSKCPRADARLDTSEAPSCQWTFDTQQYSPNPTFPTRWSSSEDTKEEGQLITSMLPMKPELKDHLLETMYSNIEMTYRVKGSVNVIVGPVYDQQPDDNEKDDYSRIMERNTPPSDYFIILTQCKTEEDILSCPPSQLELFPVVLPMDGDPNQNCQSLQQLLMIYSVRVRDVENLTGLTFYTNHYVPDSLVQSLRTQVVSRIFHPF